MKLINIRGVIMPIHPRTMSTIKKYKIKANFKLNRSLGYLDFISYLKKSSMVITDSGGVQKEAFFAKRKCITVRDETEWTELINLGVNILSDSKIYYLILKRCINLILIFQKNIWGWKSRKIHRQNN